MKIRTQSLELLGISAVIAAVVGIRACGAGAPDSAPASPVIEVTADTIVPDSSAAVKKKNHPETRRQPVSRDFLDEKVERS